VIRSGASLLLISRYYLEAGVTVRETIPATFEVLY